MSQSVRFSYGGLPSVGSRIVPCSSLAYRFADLVWAVVAYFWPTRGSRDQLVEVPSARGGNRECSSWALFTSVIPCALGHLGRLGIDGDARLPNRRVLAAWSDQGAWR